MPQQTSPFAEMRYGWNYGESQWDTGANENWLKTGFLFDGNVDGLVSSLPTVVNGQAYFLTTDNRFYFAVGGIWYSSPCPQWFTFKLRSSGDTYQYNGASAVQIDSPTEVGGRLDAVEATIASLGSAAYEDVVDLATQAELDVASAQANTYTDGVMSDHIAEADPHPQYLTQAEGDVRYLQIANTQIFGQRTVTGNTTVKAMTAAVDSTLSTNTDYSQVTGIFAALPDGIVSGVTQQTNGMLINTTGPYEIKVWSSMTSSVGNTNVAYKFAINGVISTARRPRAKIGSGGDRVNVSAHGYINLNAGDVITLWIASDTTANITIEDCVFSVVYLGGFSA